MKKKPTILFIHMGKSSFVKEDLGVLSSFGELSVFHFKPTKSFLALVTTFARQLYWLIGNIREAQAIYCWFSDYHSFLPVLFSKWFKTPSVTVLGGFDCNKIKHLNYGIFCSKWRAPLGTYVLKKSTLLLPVDETLISTDSISEYWPEAHPNGVTYNVSEFRSKWISIPTGYDPEAWKPGPTNRGKIVSTIAFCSNMRTVKIKGWDLFIEASKLMPDYEFRIIGASKEFTALLKQKYNPGENLQFIPPQNRENLEQLYHQSSVYVQLSRAEGLPNVLCEAMMCGCIPVGSPVFGIPNAIADFGFIAKKPDPEVIASLISKAHERNGTFRKEIHNHITSNYSLELRKKKLGNILGRLIDPV